MAFHAGVLRLYWLARPLLPERFGWSEIARVDFLAESVELAEVASPVPGEALGEPAPAISHRDDLRAIGGPLEVRDGSSEDGDFVLHLVVAAARPDFHAAARVAARNPLATRRKPNTTHTRRA